MDIPRSPKRAQQLLSWFCQERWINELLGDLDEEYIDNVEAHGKRRAILAYYWQVLLLIRPHILKNPLETETTPFMLKNYIISAYRSLLKNKVYGAINIFGLAVGITCCMLISLYVHDELSFDNFLKDNDRIFRVALERQYPTNTRFFSTSPVNLANVLGENYPEVEETTRLHRLFFRAEILVDFGEKTFIETNYLFADKDFFKVFSLEFVEGEPNSALDAPDKVVLTESTAKKYFGDNPALNQTFRVDTAQYIISGVIKDIPTNSHLDFELLGSIHDLPFLENAGSSNNWISPWLYTYVKLKEGARQSDLQDKLPGLFKDFGLPDVIGQLGISESDFPESGHNFNYFLQPVRDIHLKSNLDFEIKPGSDITYVYMLVAVVLFILAISCINFINLATARSTERAKEVGVRKVLGSTKSLLVKQFLTESNLVAILALIIAIAGVWLVLPSFNNLFSKSLTLSVITNPIVLPIIIMFVLIVGTLAGLYPAVVISSINSALVLKGKFRTSSKGVWLRNSLIVFQFFISITMISGTMLLNKQMNFMQNKQLGFNKENIVVIPQAQVIGQQQEAFRNEIERIDGVESVAFAIAMPGDFIGNLIIESELPDIPQVRSFTNTIDDNYLTTLGIELVAGRDFSNNFNDSLNILVNETTVELLGYDDPIGRKVINPNPSSNAPAEFTIVGVVKDYHHHSLHTEIPPMLLFNVSSLGQLPAVAVKVVSDDMLSVLGQMEGTWKDFESERPITFNFLDENLRNLYVSDLQTGKIFSLFTLVTIIMACIGLFGLAAYVTQQRTKEIGIRKVLGASISGIILLLSTDFTKLIAMSFLISLPLVYYGINSWLDNFAYRTGIDPFTLLGAGFLTLFLAWLTISYYSIKIAVLNPVKSLRSE